MYAPNTTGSSFNADSASEKEALATLDSLHNQKDTMIESGEWNNLNTTSQVYIDDKIKENDNFVVNTESMKETILNMDESGMTGTQIKMKQMTEQGEEAKYFAELFSEPYKTESGFEEHGIMRVHNELESLEENKIWTPKYSEGTFEDTAAGSFVSNYNMEEAIKKKEGDWVPGKHKWWEFDDNSKGAMSHLGNNKDVNVGTAGNSDVVDGVDEGFWNSTYDREQQIKDFENSPHYLSEEKPQKKKGQTKTVMGTKNIGENVLYNLEPYTYEFTLSAMSREEYAKGGSYEIASRQNIIIKTSGLPKGSSSSASEHANEFAGTSKQLAPGSQLNHHIRGVYLKSIIGLNSQTITSNTHGIKFSVFEPFGASLLDDLHDAAVSVGFSNYLKGIYLLTLKFHGYNDDGKPTPWGGVGRSKFFPLKLTNCELSVSGGGTEYNFEAVPYNANTLEDNRMKVTQPIVLAGSSVGELLFELQNQLNEQPRINDDQAEGGYSIQIVGNPAAVTTGDVEVDREIEMINAGIKGTPKSILIGGYGSEQGIMASTLFHSPMNHDKLSPSMGKVSIELTSEGKKLYSGKHFTSPQNKDEIAAIKFNDKYNYRTYTWNRGTSVLDIIQSIIDSSDYIMRQVKGVDEMNVQANSNGEIPWYKIDYKFVDASNTKTTNRFLVRPYWIDQYIALPNLDTSVKFNVKEVAREYNYIYTGKNRDILDFNLQYNFAFFTAITAQKDKTPGSTGDSIAQSDVLEKENKHFTHPRNRVKDEGKIVIESKVTDHDSRSTTQGGELGSVTGYKKASIIKEQLSNPRADLLGLELEILGDPFYLVQEDFNPGLKPRSEVNAYELKDGSIDANRGEVYLRVNFKTPVDLDDETGRLKGLNGVGKYDTSFFGGFYRLLQIESTFEEGRFIQRLDMVRCRYQELESPKTPIQSGGDAGEFAWPIDGSSSNVSETGNNFANPGGTGEPFSVGSSSEEETQTEANIHEGFHSAMVTQKADLASIGIDQNNLMGNFSSIGAVIDYATTNEKRKNNDAILNNHHDKTKSQTNVVSGLDKPKKKMNMNEHIGLEKAKFNQNLPGADAGQAEFSTMNKDMASIGLNFDMFSGGGSNNFLMGGGNPVSNLLGFIQKDQKTKKNEVVEEVKEEGSKKTTYITKKDGNKVTKIKETVLENDGEQEITTTEETIGTDKYGGLTREEYYSGKSATTGEVTYRAMRWRNRERIKEEGQAMGLSEKTIQKMIKHFNKSHPNPEWEERKNKKELLKKKHHG